MKKVLAVLLTAIFVAAASVGASAALPSDKLVAGYSFDEITGGSAADVTGNNNAVVDSGVTVASDSVRGKVFEFDGSDTAFVTLPEGIMQDCDDITIALWYQYTGSANWIRVVDFGSGTGQYIFITPQSGTLNAVAGVIKNNGGEEIVSNTDVIYDEWVHLAYTITGGKSTLYINGEMVDQIDCTIIPSDLGATSQNWIGKSQYSADAYFTGYVDDLAIFSTALTEAQVKELMNTSLTGGLASAPAEESTQAPATTTPAPSTGDMGIIVVVAVAVCAFAALIFVMEKSKRNI